MPISALYRRRHPRHPLRRLRLRREHHRVPARVQARHRTARPCPPGCTSTTGRTSAPSNSRWCAPSSASRSSTPDPTSPPEREKIERWFRTVRAGWLSHLTAQATTSLDTLNRTLWAWVEGEYHRSPHRGLDGRTPLDQWALAGHDVRYPDPGLDLDDLFLFEAKTPRDERPYGEPARTALRGRRRPGRPNRHLALRPPRSAFAPHRRRPTTERAQGTPPASTPTPTPASSATGPPGRSSATPRRRSPIPRRFRCETSRTKTDVPASLRPHPAAVRNPRPHRRAVRIERPARGPKPDSSTSSSCAASAF